MDQLLGSSSEDFLEPPVRGGRGITTREREHTDLSATIRGWGSDLEHARLTPVFGTSCPPRGLSGVLRDVGYKFSEGRLSRWLTLLFADRVDVVEGVVDDLARGHIPNVWKEMGLATELRYNREAFVRKAAVTAGVAALLVIAWKARSRR